MNEEIKNNYYAIIPATVRYNVDLKPNEKLLYGEITALANSKGFCFASNRYFAELYKVTIHTVPQWISHLEKLGYVNIELIKDEKKEIKERRIYICDTPYLLKNTYPIYKKVQDNNINIKIDDLFLFIINNSDKISNEFYSIINHLEFNYTKDILSIMKEDKIEMIKEIIYTLYSLYNTDFKYILSKLNRDELINIYIISKEHNPNDFLNYYKMDIINKSVVVAAVKMIANSNNPQKRSESIGSLAWICGGGVVLGASLIIAGIIINIATNNSGNLLGSWVVKI